MYTCHTLTGVTLLLHSKYMATTKKRINISVPENVENAIARLAERDQLPQATKAGELLRLAIEIEEDQVWDDIASARDNSKTKFIDHKEAWV